LFDGNEGQGAVAAGGERKMRVFKKKKKKKRAKCKMGKKN
jgi:hypothetical protein